MQNKSRTIKVVLRKDNVDESILYTELLYG